MNTIQLSNFDYIRLEIAKTLLSNIEINLNDLDKYEEQFDDNFQNNNISVILHVAGLIASQLNSGEI